MKRFVLLSVVLLVLLLIGQLVASWISPQILGPVLHPQAYGQISTILAGNIQGVSGGCTAFSYVVDGQFTSTKKDARWVGVSEAGTNGYAFMEDPTTPLDFYTVRFNKTTIAETGTLFTLSNSVQNRTSLAASNYDQTTEKSYIVGDFNVAVCGGIVCPGVFRLNDLAFDGSSIYSTISTNGLYSSIFDSTFLYILCDCSDVGPAGSSLARRILKINKTTLALSAVLTLDANNNSGGLGAMAIDNINGFLYATHLFPSTADIRIDQVTLSTFTVNATLLMAGITGGIASMAVDNANDKLYVSTDTAFGSPAQLWYNNLAAFTQGSSNSYAVADDTQMSNKGLLVDNPNNSLHSYRTGSGRVLRRSILNPFSLQNFLNDNGNLVVNINSFTFDLPSQKAWAASPANPSIITRISLCQQ